MREQRELARGSRQKAMAVAGAGMWLSVLLQGAAHADTSPAPQASASPEASSEADTPATSGTREWQVSASPTPGLDAKDDNNTSAGREWMPSPGVTPTTSPSALPTARVTIINDNGMLLHAPTRTPAPHVGSGHLAPAVHPSSTPELPFTGPEGPLVVEAAAGLAAMAIGAAALGLARRREN